MSNISKKTISKKIAEIQNRIETIEQQLDCRSYQHRTFYCINVKMPYFDIDNYLTDIKKMSPIFVEEFLKQNTNICENYLENLSYWFFSDFLECNHLDSIRSLKEAKELLNKTGFVGLRHIDSIKAKTKRFKAFEKYYSETILAHQILDSFRERDEISSSGRSSGYITFDLINEIESLKEDLQNILTEIKKGETLDYINWLWENIKIFDLEKLEFIIPIIHNSKPSKKGFEYYLDSEIESSDTFGRIEFTDEIQEDLTKRLLEYFDEFENISDVNFYFLGDIESDGIKILFNPNKNPLEAIMNMETGVYQMFDKYDIKRLDTLKNANGNINETFDEYNKLN